MNLSIISENTLKYTVANGAVKSIFICPSPGLLFLCVGMLKRHDDSIYLALTELAFTVYIGGLCQQIN